LMAFRADCPMSMPHAERFSAIANGPRIRRSTADD
jgi:hypothetical protein